MKIAMKAILAGLGLAALVTTAWATVTFSSSNGTGFIGRGDVITYCGKSCLVMSPSIVFTDMVQYDWDCLAEWDTVTGGKNSKVIHHVNQQSRQRLVTDTVTIDSTTRQATGNGNISGYLLNGFGGTLTPPFTEAQASAACPEGSPDPTATTTTWTLVPGSFVTTTINAGTLTFQGVTIPF